MASCTLAMFNLNASNSESRLHRATLESEPTPMGGRGAQNCVNSNWSGRRNLNFAWIETVSHSDSFKKKEVRLKTKKIVSSAFSTYSWAGLGTLHAFVAKAYRLASLFGGLAR
jgi:hypothetical protein